MITSSLRLLLLTIGMAVAATASSQVVKPQAVPKTKLMFTQIGKWPTHSLDVDKSTVSKRILDDGTVMVGGMFKMTVAQPIALENGKSVSYFVNAVVGMCGKNEVMLLNSKAYSPTGELLNELTEPKRIDDEDQPSAPTTEIYRFLCPKSIRNNPINSNKWA